MDNYILKIVTLSSHEIKKKIYKVRDIDRITTSCLSGDINNPASYNKADVIFLNYSQATQDIQTILDNKATYTSIILLNDNTYDQNPDLLKYDLWDTSDVSFSHHLYALKNNMRDKFDLELTKNQLYTLIDSVPDLIWYKDLNGLHLDVNDAFCKSIGKSVDDIKEQIKYRDQGYLMGLTPEEFASGDFACIATDNHVIKHQKTSLFDEKVLIHHGMRQFKTYKTALLGRDGESIGTVGMAHDVTDIWNTHEEFRIVISRLPFPMIILDKDYNLLSFNSKFGDLFDFHEENQSEFVISTFGEKFFNSDISLLEFSNTSITKQMTDKNMNILHFIIEKSEITDVFGEKSGYFYIFRDITKTCKYEEKLRLLAETDELTQINNRKAIRDFYENKLQILSHNQSKFAVVLMDIDYFKLYNDHYGHLEGDMVIKSFANILKSRSDNENVFVARFGGEEFILLAIDKDPLEVKSLVEDIMQDLLKTQIKHEKSTVSDIVTVSAGIYYSKSLENNVKLTDLIEKADQNLYEAKNQGRNRYFSNI